MRPHRFIGNFDLASPELEIKEREIVNQIARVLRLKKGASVILGDGRGGEATAKIRSLRPGKITVALTPLAGSAAPDRVVVLYCSILKKENFEWVVLKATETGVSEIVPVRSARTVKTNLNMERLRKIAKEAAEQSGRKTVPVVREPASWEDALAHAAHHDMNVFLHTGTPRIFRSFPNRPKTAGVWIGPEGGWTEEEAERVRAADNFMTAGLGDLTLRAETAAVVASYLAVQAN